ncbi:MAG: hypothetical protein IKZ58_07005 [Selenomonadaceae bacterium]|nr:hypothetical protein [Selenomonadaceae bacterium]
MDKSKLLNNAREKAKERISEENNGSSGVIGSKNSEVTQSKREVRINRKVSGRKQ